MARYRDLSKNSWGWDADDEDDRDGPRLSPAVRAQLGRRLRDFYAALALGEQPVPQHFIELVNRLDRGQAAPRQEKRS